MTENEFMNYIILYRNNIYRLALSYVKNNEDAEDISQEAFLKLYKCDEVFDSPENVRAWLIRVTINLSKNLLKNFWRQRRSELYDEIPVYSVREEVVVEFLRRLKPKYAAVLHLFLLRRVFNR